MSESGFEVAAAYVRVSPDVADFPALLDEAIGGLQVAIAVVPGSASLADFAAAVGEGVGDLTATVSVGADTARAEAQVEDLLSNISGMRGSLMVGADVSNLEQGIGENVGSASVTVTPDMTKFADMVMEDAAGLEVPVPVIPDAAGLDAPRPPIQGARPRQVLCEPANLLHDSDEIGGGLHVRGERRVDDQGAGPERPGGGDVLFDFVQRARKHPPILA